MVACNIYARLKQYQNYKIG